MSSRITCDGVLPHLRAFAMNALLTIGVTRTAMVTRNALLFGFFLIDAPGVACYCTT